VDPSGRAQARARGDEAESCAPRKREGRELYPHRIPDEGVGSDLNPLKQCGMLDAHTLGDNTIGADDCSRAKDTALMDKEDKGGFWQLAHTVTARGARAESALGGRLEFPSIVLSRGVALEFRTCLADDSRRMNDDVAPHREASRRLGERGGRHKASDFQM